MAGREHSQGAVAENLRRVLLPGAMAMRAASRLAIMMFLNDNSETEGAYR